MKNWNEVLVGALVLPASVLMDPVFQPEPFRLKTFLLGLALNSATAAVLVAVSYRYPNQRGYFYATVAGLFAIGVAWAVVSYRKRRPPP